MDICEGLQWLADTLLKRSYLEQEQRQIQIVLIVKRLKWKRWLLSGIRLFWLTRKIEESPPVTDLVSSGTLRLFPLIL